MKLDEKKDIMGQFHNSFNDEILSSGIQIDPCLIGEIIMTFNGLESDLEGCFCDFIHGNSAEPGMIILRSMTYYQKCEIRYKYITRLIYMSDKNGITRLEKLAFKMKSKTKRIQSVFERLKTCGMLRNKIVHGFREEQDKEGYIRTSNVNFGEEGIIATRIKVGNKDLRKIIKYIKVTRNKLDKIHQNFGY